MNEVTVLRNKIKEFVDTASPKELEMAFHLFDAAKKDDWWDEITTEHQDAIDKGLSQLNKGKGVPHKEVMKNYYKWLKK